MRIERDLLSITDLHNLTNTKKSVGNWLKLQSTRNLVATVSSKLKRTPESLYKYEAGKYGSVFIHWYIALQYAKYIDVYNYVLDYLHTQKVYQDAVWYLLNNSDVDAINYWQLLRDEYKISFRDFSSAIKESNSDIYRDASAITVIAVAGEKVTPDNSSSEILRSRINLQNLIAKKLRKSKVSGNEQCLKTIKETAVAWIAFESSIAEERIPTDKVSKVLAYN